MVEENPLVDPLVKEAKTPQGATPTSKKFDFLVFIGRFQPFHNGHLRVIERALQEADQLIILCGSAHQPRNTRNPWSVSERELMIRGAFSPEQNTKLHFAPLMDVMYNDDVWVRNVQSTVNGLVTAHNSVLHKQPSIGLIGHSKDHTSYYLNLFPQWGAVNVENFEGLSATPYREAFFMGEEGGGKQFLASGKAQKNLPQSTHDVLESFIKGDAFTYIQAEQAFIANYKKAWENAPYPPIFVTVDAVIVQSGHVLMVRRKASPGAGLMALPGGFVDQNESLQDACLRELKEETRLKVPMPVLKGSIKGQRVFDNPHRSTRGRTITHAFFIELAPNSALPKVKGGDDAKNASWIPLADLQPAQLYEDHYFIIREMLGL